MWELERKAHLVRLENTLLAILETIDSEIRDTDKLMNSYTISHNPRYSEDLYSVSLCIDTDLGKNPYMAHFVSVNIQQGEYISCRALYSTSIVYKIHLNHKSYFRLDSHFENLPKEDKECLENVLGKVGLAIVKNAISQLFMNELMLGE